MKNDWEASQVHRLIHGVIGGSDGRVGVGGGGGANSRVVSVRLPLPVPQSRQRGCLTQKPNFDVRMKGGGGSTTLAVISEFQQH